MPPAKGKPKKAATRKATPAGPLPQKDAGLKCPNCGCRHSHCVYVRHFKPGYVRRCRECRNCGRRYYSKELVSENEPQQRINGWEY